VTAQPEDPLAVSLAVHIWAFAYRSALVLLDPATVLLAVDERPPPLPSIRIAVDPVAGCLAVHIRAFTYLSVLVLNDPATVPVAVDIGAFTYRSALVPLEPAAVPVAIDDRPPALPSGYR